MNISEFVRAKEEALEAKREAAAVQQGMDVQFNAPLSPEQKRKVETVRGLVKQAFADRGYYIGKDYDPSNSAQVCGCDQGADHTCERHKTHTYKPAMSIAHWEKDRPLLPEPNVKNVRTKPMTGIGGAPTRATTLPVDAKGRKEHPLASGVLDYFPDALVALSHVSWRGNEQHNLGKALHWDRSKSADEADTAMRHFVERGTMDTDGIRHTAKFAWRALAMLQKEIEQEKV